MIDEDRVFSQLDADKIKEEAVEAAKDALISKLSGGTPKYSWEQRGKNRPDNYDELFDEVKKQTSSISEDDAKRVAREEFNKLQTEREEQQQKQVEEGRKKQLETAEEQRKQFDNDWYELVKENKMPAPSKEVQERINKGETLTREEILADEGLKARLELVELAKGKSAKLAFYEDYGKQPAGATAPVLGGRPASTQKDSEEFDYADIEKNRKKMFGF